MAVDVGAKAPDFTLPNQDREQVTLSEQIKKGPVVLAFFPAAFSGVCTKEMCTFRDSMAELNKVSAHRARREHRHVLLAEGVGRSAEAHVPAAQRLQQGRHQRSTASSTRTWSGLKDISRRAVFVIGRDGTVKHREVLDDARNEPDYSKVKQAVASA